VILFPKEPRSTDGYAKATVTPLRHFRRRAVGHVDSAFLIVIAGSKNPQFLLYRVVSSLLPPQAS